MANTPLLSPACRGPHPSLIRFAALTRIEQNWHESSAALLIEMVYRVPNWRVLLRLVGMIEKASGVAFDGDVNACPPTAPFGLAGMRLFPDTRLVK